MELSKIIKDLKETMRFDNLIMVHIARIKIKLM